MNARTLVASVNGREVGYLRADDGVWAFEYSDGWQSYDKEQATFSDSIAVVGHWPWWAGILSRSRLAPRASRLAPNVVEITQRARTSSA